ncbi:amino acid--[acyl-carrier-protein] ligase [Saccharophagus degradans]|uniref:amino acid--[acyl-carrier-protein] ligase n=1 Tax=Saccharophagus degradans TaxID=86304 RepID=UPI001C0A3044|nr:amino acid--[acyl-carrier-protein] ligase [Saccharophagus degradans]MBU2986867.1 amino acid--[acyl-carrier-protein] ligase [Saccharophagus degradans]
MCISDQPITEAYLAYQKELVDAGLLIPSGVKGVYGRSGLFEKVVDQFEAFATRMGADANAEVMRFPPIFGRHTYMQTDHVETMPDLMGSVNSFCGNEKEHRALIAKIEEKDENWCKELTPTDVMLVPAACYPLYPTASGSVLPEGGRTVDLKTFVFRHEPSDDPARMQIFRQREYVRLGTPEQALQHRNHWLQTAEGMHKELGLEVEVVVANDPFFGRGGRVMKATQREQELKFEIVTPICSEEKPTAITSCNCHLDHFGHSFNIKTADGEPAHTSCIGFGLERIALALFKTHGLDPSRWPEKVRKTLQWT